MQDKFDFFRNGVLRFPADQSILNSLPLLILEADNFIAKAKEGAPCEDFRSSWDAHRGWGDAQVHSQHIVQAFSGDIGRIVQELVGVSVKDHVQYAFTENCSNEENINEHRDGASGDKVSCIGRYSLQVGVLLQDVNTNDGPFVYWPGSHHLAIIHAKVNPQLSPYELIRADFRLRDRAKYCSFTGSAGDVIVSHPLMTHGTLRNQGKRRVIAFSRVNWREDYGRDLFNDPWEDFMDLYKSFFT